MDKCLNIYLLLIDVDLPDGEAVFSACSAAVTFPAFWSMIQTVVDNSETRRSITTMVQTGRRAAV
jgi:hypothetical protein